MGRRGVALELANLSGGPHFAEVDRSSISSAPWVVIPAYEPSTRLVELVETLSKFLPVLVVNDGSSPHYRSTFDQLEKLPHVHVVEHATNRGKGHALKTAINQYLLLTSPHSPGIVTADADGQHLASDILSVLERGLESNELTLGVRRFPSSVPLRSRVGNTLTSFFFTLIFGHKISDTQTGLRFVPRRILPRLLQISYNKYEYELAMLVQAVNDNEKIREVPIKTIYIDGNASSHFNPIRDSLSIYCILLRFSATSLATAIIDYTVFWMVFTFIGTIFWSILAARVIAGTFNFIFSKRLVFRSKNAVLPEILGYLALVTVLMSLSWVLTEALYKTMGGHVLLAKAFAEGSLFFTSFVIQRSLIFQRHE